MKDLNIDNSWTIFIDRDGVINFHRENDYVKNWKEFEFINNSHKAFEKLNKIFQIIILVTNQRGIGKKLMTEEDLKDIHNNMVSHIKKHNGTINKIYHCPDLENSSPNRKPNPGMAYKAKQDFAQIDFNKSIMVGDSNSDMKFGKKLGMTCIYIEGNHNVEEHEYNYKFSSLDEFAQYLIDNN